MDMVNVSFHMGNNIRFIIDATNNFGVLISSVTCHYSPFWQQNITTSIFIALYIS